MPLVTNRPFTTLAIFLEQQKFQGSGLQTNGFFGKSVAITPDGNTAIVGANNETTTFNADGSAYIFVRNGTVWSEHQKLVTNDTAVADVFGESVAISDDGNTVIIGGVGHNPGPGQTGAAYVFIKSVGSPVVWTQQEKLLASDLQSSDNFGFSVAISSDGNTAIVGSPYEDALGGQAGAAYVYTRSGITWSEQQKIVANDAEASDFYGYSVSLAGDGDTAIIGARGEDTGGAQAGAAYIHTRTGITWSHLTKIQGSDTDTADGFGYSVALSSDGTTAIVGASGSGVGGAAYVFIDGITSWPQQQKLTASDTASSDGFGRTVAITPDGNNVIIGAVTKRSAYTFARSGVTWSEQQQLTPGDPESGDEFGGNVDISSDGNTVIISARLKDTGASNAGAAYIFVK